jgi:hypothetical protein
MLAPRETREFQIEVKFLISQEFEDEERLEILEFSQLKTTLAGMDLQLAALDFSIKGKDLLEKPL